MTRQGWTRWRKKLLGNGCSVCDWLGNDGVVTRLFIETFGDHDKVGPASISHFMYGGGWSGPKSEYLGRKRDKARKWLSEALTGKIQIWLTQYIETLNAEIESAQIGEEREF